MPIAIVGNLKPGWEDIDRIAARLGDFFGDLAEVDALFSCWERGGTRRHRSIVPLLVTIPPEQTELRSWLEENEVFESREGRKKAVGYSLRAVTPAQNPVCADFWLSYLPEGFWFGHRMGITLSSDGASPSQPSEPSDPRVLIALLRKVLLITGLAFSCDWAGVSPGDYRTASEQPPNGPLCKYQSGWMVYLGPEPAARIVAPQDIASERLPNGGMLLIAAPNTRFNSRQQDHREAALRIQAALAPLNAADDTRTH